MVRTLNPLTGRYEADKVPTRPYNPSTILSLIKRIERLEAKLFQPRQTTPQY